MAGPRFADLQRQGTPVRFDDLVRDGGEVEEAPSGVESFARGAYQGAGMGFADEQAGALDALGGHLKRTFTNDWKHTGGGWWDDIKAEAQQVADDYRKGRDESRQAYSEAAEANPTAYGVGQFGGAVATGLLTGGASSLGRAGLKGALTAGGLEGAAGGLGGSNADLTYSDLDAYAKAFRDSAEGGIAGAGLGAGFYGAGKGLKWIGGKAVAGLRGARAELEAGVSAEREAADDVARAAEEKAARAEAKRVAKEARDAARAKSQQQKDFRAANERTQVDKRYADPNVIPIRRGAPAPQAAPDVPMEDPNTAILGGYRGKAGERRAVNYDRVQQYRRDIADPNFSGDRARLEQYAREYGDAVDNPGAFERRMVERYLRENYPPEVADRILRERVGPNGEILPRGGSQEPVTQAADLGDAFRQGRGPEVARQGGGGSAFGQDYPADARTVSDVVPEGWDPSAPRSGDPFHDAPTRAALIRTSPEGGIQGLTENPLHQFEFRDPKTGKDFSASFEVDPSNPEVVHLNYVGPAGVDPRVAMVQGYDASKNVLGPGMVKQMAAEAARAFPGAKRMSAWRITGANADRNMEIRLPEVTQMGEAIPAPSRAPYVDPDARTMVDPNVRDLLPPANPNARRTAGIYEVPLSELDDVPAAGARKPVAAAEVRRALDRGEELPPVRVGQGPDGLRELEDGNHRLAAYRERGTPNVWAQFESDAAAQVNPNRARGTSIFDEAVAPIDSRPPGREPPVSGDDLRQWLDLTQEMPSRTPDGLPPMEDITSPGAPAFPRDPADMARRSPVFAPPPELRGAYRPAPPAEAVPTQNLRAAAPPAAQPRPAPAYNPNNSMVSPRDFDAETVVPLGDTQVPRAPRPGPYGGPVAPELAPEPVLANPLRQARPRPLAPPVAPPAQTIMGAPPGSLVRQARQSVGEIAQQREQDALGGLVRAGWEGARDANNALAAPFGAAYGIGKEALQNPAVRARAISVFRLDRLARVRPEVWARVGPTLQRAFQAGPERFKAERHVLLLRDPEFRAAEAEADAELERMDGQPPTRRAAGAR